MAELEGRMVSKLDHETGELRKRLRVVERVLHNNGLMPGAESEVINLLQSGDQEEEGDHAVEALVPTGDEDDDEDEDLEGY